MSLTLLCLRHFYQMFRQRHPLPAATNVRHCISVDGGIRLALFGAALRVRAHNDGCVLVENHIPVRQGLRFGWIGIFRDDELDEAFFIQWLVGAEAGNEFVIQNAAKRSRVVIVLGYDPDLL